MKNKTMLASLFAAFALTATAGVGGMLTNTANAEISGLGMFKIEDGAAVRITGTEDIQDGLRFKVKMDATTVAKIVDATSVSGVEGTDENNDYKLYAVIAPTDLVTNNDFTNVEADRWVEIDESKIYYDLEYKCYYANAVLTNVKESNRTRTFTMGAVIKNGTDSVWAEPANEGYQNRSLYQTLNLAALSAEEDTAKILNNAGTTYKSWFGKDGYPLVVTTEAQLNSIITDVTSGAYSFEEKNIYVDSALKATETYTTAVAEGGSLNAIAAELDATYYDVTFKADANTTLYTYKAKSGETATYNGWEFSKPADGLNNTYTNNGWDKELGTVNANVTYTAEFAAVANDKFTTFKQFYYEKKTIDGNEEVLTTLGGIVPTSNRYPYAYLSNTYAWADGKALTFNVLNNSSDYEFTFAVYMNPNNNTSFSPDNAKLIGSYTVEPNDTQTVTIYASDFNYNTYKYVTIYTTHNYNSNGQWNANAQDEVATNELDFAAFNISAYGFTFEDKAKPVTDDYKQASEVTATKFYASVNANKDYVYDGDYSMALVSYGTSGMELTFDSLRTYDWSKPTNLTFQVYNPYTSDYRIYADLTDGDTTTDSKLCRTVIDLAPQAWTEVSISTVGKEIKENSAVVIWTAWNEGNNEILDGTTFTGANNAKWRAFRLYFDSFEFEESVEVIELKSNFNSHGQEVKTINGETKTVLTMSGITPSVNRYPYAVFPMEYEWAAGKALTFTVYNNSDTYEFTFDYYMCKEANAFDDKQDQLIGYATVEPNDTQTITIYAEDFDYNTYKYLAIHTSHAITSNGQANGSPQDDVATGELDLASFNISTYDFTFEDKAKPTTDDYKQAAEIEATKFNVGVNTNKAYVYSGEYSFSMTGNGTSSMYVYLEALRGYDLSNKIITFKVYNPYKEAYRIKAGLTDGNTTTIMTDGRKEIDVLPGEWTTVTVDASSLTVKENSTIVIWSAWNEGSNEILGGTTFAGANNAKWRAFRLYVDDFIVS